METEKWIGEATQADVLVQLAAVAAPGRSNTEWLKAGALLNTNACRALTDAALAGGNCKALITASGIYAAGSHGDSWVNEKTKKREHPLADFWEPNESAVFKARKLGINATALRFGQVYGPDPEGTFGKFFLAMAQKKKLRYMGRGTNYYPFVHIDDAVSAIIKVSQSSNNEPIIHIVDDHPVQMKESMGAMLKSFGQNAKSAPILLARLMAGKPMFEGFTGSYRSENGLAKKDLGWTPKYPSFTKEIKNVVSEFQRLQGN